MLVVEKKIVVNLSMPETIHAVYESLSQEVGGNAKWTVISAALVAFQERSLDEQRVYISRVRAADGDPDGMAQLLSDASDGHLRASVELEVKRRRELMERIKRTATGKAVDPKLAARRAPSKDDGK